MCCSLNLYMKYIYAEYFMVYLLRVRPSGWSLRIILQHGGGGARRMRPLAPPPPCWRLILLDTQAQQYGGGGARWRDGEEADLTLCDTESCIRLWLMFRGQLPLLLYLIFFTPCSSFTIWEGQMPHLLQLISDEGKHFWTTLTWVLNSWLFFHPKLLIGTLAMWIPPSQFKAGGRV